MNFHFDGNVFDDGVGLGDVLRHWTVDLNGSHDWIRNGLIHNDWHWSVTSRGSFD